MIMRSLVFANEFVDRVDFDRLRAIETGAEFDAQDPLGLFKEGPFRDEQQAENARAPARVSDALLAEPLRIYYTAVKQEPRLRDPAIERIAGPGSVPPVLSRYRNMVFHVTSTHRENPNYTERKFFEEIPTLALRLLPNAMRFFMSIN